MELILNEIKELKKLLLEQNSLHKEILTVEEASAFLQLSKSCLYKLTSKKETPFYCPNGKKIYFRKSDIENWVFESRVSSSDDIEQEVENYLGRTNKICVK